jgi:putative holliday junction resolvase
MAPRPGRVLGVDVGRVRVGLALSDPDRLVATPVGTIAGGEDVAVRLAARAMEEDCNLVVVGLPLGMSGADTDSTRMARGVAAALERNGVQVALWDERLSSAEADRSLRARGRDRAQRKKERDQIAAAIILQGWLDADRTTETEM